MSLKTILDEIKVLQPQADEDTDSGPRETLAGRRGRKARAIESLKDLKRHYTDELRKTAAFIVVLGDKRNEFTALAKENFKCFSTDPDSFFSFLVDRVPPTTYAGRESIANLFDILGRHIEEKMTALTSGGSYPQLIYRQEYGKTIRNRKDFLDLVRQALTDQMGGELVGINAAYDLTEEAIKRNEASNYAPIILSTGEEKFGLTVAKDLERISKRVFVVYAGETTVPAQGLIVKEPTEESVKKILKKIDTKITKGN